MNFKSLFIIILAISLKTSIIGQEIVKWLSFEEAIEKNKNQPRKILIDVYTDWCGWCKVMDEKTFGNATIAEYLNKNYYPVKFNAEGHDTIQFAGKTYINDGVGRRPTHKLAIALLNGKMSYPSIAYMDENNQLITAVPGYWEAKKIEPLLEFIKKDIYKTNTSFEDFSNNFQGKVQ